jgi:hypothetical protein
MPLRPSQVETLRAVEGFPRRIKPAELGGICGPPGGLSVRAAEARLRTLCVSRYLDGCRCCGYSLTQLGREALMHTEVRVLEIVCASQPTFSNGVRLVDPVDRVLAGDDLVEVAKDFNLRPEEVELALRVFASAGGRVSKSYHYLRREALEEGQ